MKHLLISLTVAASVLHAPVYAGQDIDTPGLLINETRTFAGQEFFTAFATVWQAYDPDSRYTLVIFERPSARSGSQITVNYLGNVIYRRFISFNAKQAHHAGELASADAFRAVMTVELDRTAIDPDLGTDEL